MCRGENYEQVDEEMNGGDTESTEKKCTSTLAEGRITLDGSWHHYGTGYTSVVDCGGIATR